MSRQTFDGTGSAWQEGFEAPLVEQRLSILAVCSLVFAILCFIPGLGLIAAICGISALFFISSSRGRLSGKGMAIAGIVVGLLMTSLWGGAVVGAMQLLTMFNNQVAGPAMDVIAGSQAGDYARARSGLTPVAAAKVQDAEFDAFRDAYTAKLGAFQHPAQTLSQLVGGWATLGPQMQKFQGRQDCIPVPAEFEKGRALVVFQMDMGDGSAGGTNVSVNGTQVRTSNGVRMPVKNIQIITADGDAFILFDLGTAATNSGFGPDEITKSRAERRASRKKAATPTPQDPDATPDDPPADEDADAPPVPSPKPNDSPSKPGDGR